MSLLKALHERWASYRPLAELAPPEQVVTGAALGELPLPRVSLARQPDRAVTHTSSGHRLRAAIVRLTICDGDYDSACRVASAIDTLLHHAEFDYADGRVLDARLAGREEQSGSDGVWRIALDYLMTVDETKEP